jgi:cell wall assembly regulator SMI1
VEPDRGWMRAHAPEALEVLHAGASDDTIRAAEEALGRELPESYRRSVARHDGQQERWPSLIEFGFLMPLQDVVTRSRELEKWLEETRGDTCWWRRGWVPFVSRDGDYLSLDLAPRVDADRGRVWCFLHDNDPMHSVVASSYGAWLTRWADELEAGVFALDRAAGAGLLPRQPSVRSRLWPN